MAQHPITPPPELVQAWSDEALTASGMFEIKMKFATYASRWGADQELYACCEWLDREGWSGESRQLRAARRPKPPSLKDQALEALAHILNNSSTQLGADTIRRALEQLDD
jgi:hypothetical protein